MEKRNYVRPIIGCNNIATVSFIAGSKDGLGGTTCNEFVTDTILEYLFMISTESNNQGGVDTAKLKCYLQDNDLTIKVKTGFDNNININDTGITVTGSGRNNKLAQVAGLSFNDGSYYSISVNEFGCFVFEKTTSGDAPYWKDLTNYICKQ